MRNQKGLRLLPMLLAVILGAAGCEQPQTQGNTIRIAAVAPTTGAQAEVGQDLINGIRLAVDEKNSQGGVL